MPKNVLPGLKTRCVRPACQRKLVKSKPNSRASISRLWTNHLKKHLPLGEVILFLIYQRSGEPVLSTYRANTAIHLRRDKPILCIPEEKPKLAYVLTASYC